MARVLIVDDDASVRKLLTKLLTRNGYTCAAASSAGEALRRLDGGEEFAVVLADVLMPGPSGLALATELAARHPDTAVVMVSGVDDAQTAKRAIEAGAYGYVLKPFRAPEILITVMNAVRRRDAERENRRHREALEELVAARTAEVTRANALLAKANERLRQAQAQIIERLSIASEVRDQETGAHISRMSRYSAIVADEYGLDAERTELIRVASPLHDVGKIGISDHILRKPGRHTPEEFELMKLHTVFGYQTLAGTGFPLLDVAATIAWTHHERWDGGGYPRGLAGEAIPLEGRIVAVADVFDALTTKRVYKPAFSIDRAVDIIGEGRGSHFDPDVVDCFMRRLDDVLAVQARFPDEAPRVSFQERHFSGIADG